MMKRNSDVLFSMRPIRFVSILIWLSIFLVADLHTGFAIIQDVPVQPEPVPENLEESVPDRPVEFLTLEMATNRSRISGQPIMIFVQASWCASCTAMKGEFQTDDFQTAKAEWNLVSLDMDRDADDVLKFRVDAVPAFLLLDAAGQEVARRTAMISGSDLAKWMKSGRKLAMPEPASVLVSSEAPTKTESLELIELMGSSSPEVREIAISRMASHPEKTRSRAVDALSEATLASRLGLLDLFARWQAPVDGIDPWDSASLTEDRLKLLQVWCDTPIDELGKAFESVTPEQLASATVELDRFVNDSTEATRLLPRFSRYGKHLLPAVYERLGKTEMDVHRQRLLALRYWLVASNQLRLAWSPGFVQLGSVDLDIRREAVREVLNRVTSRDADLLLELFGDSDPLIREFSLRGLQKVGASQTDEALIRLLSDPDLNVRAAVLKLLAEQKPERMIPHVAAYLEKETDSDLLVHGLRFFKETANETQQLPILIKLSSNSSWQVRAMVAEVLGELGTQYNSPATIKVAVADTLLKLVDDSDAFVVTRAVEHMPAPKTTAMMDRLAAIVDKRPELAEKVVVVMSKSDRNIGSSSSANISPLVHFMKFIEDERPVVRVAGITGLAGASINKIEFEKFLADPDAKVRIATARAYWQKLEGLQDFTENVAFPSSGAARKSNTVLNRPPEPSIVRSIVGGIFGDSSRREPHKATLTEVEPFEEELEAQPEIIPDEMVETESESIAEVETETEAETDTQLSPDEIANEQPEPDSEAVKALAREKRLGRLPPEQAEKWINEWVAATESRPDWIKSTLPLLEAMADSDNADERLPALMALVAIQPDQERINALFELASNSADSFYALAGVLKWLPFGQRTELLHRMLDQPKHVDLKNALIVQYASVRSLAGAEVLWQLTDRKDLKSQALYQSILGASFGDNQSYYSTLDDPEDVSSFLLEEVAERTTLRLNDPQSSSVTRQIALTLLYWMDQPAAAKLADGILSENSDAELTNIALQIRLATLDPNKFEAGAVPLLKMANAAGKKAVLQKLAYGPDNSMRFTSDGSLQLPYHYSSDYGYSSSDEPKLRVPKAPDGLELADIAGLLDGEDAEARALATYYSILLDETQSVTSMIEFWSRNKNDEHLSQMVVDVVARRGDDSLIPVVSEIYELHGGISDSSFSSSVYWTIRSMSGPAALALRQRIREEVGMNRLD